MTDADSPGSLELVYADALSWLEQHWNPDLSVRQWWALIAESGWAYPTWPREWFGRGLPASATMAVRDAFARVGALGPPVRAGQKLAAPTLLVHASEAQKAQFIPALARGEEQWSQFFSEPGAGSDLAGMRTRAERDGDDWIINGQKIWSSFAQYSDRGILLARTDFDVPKHKGLSFFVIDLDQPGVEVKPLRQMNGNQEFNEVFFTNLRVPGSRLVGRLGEGWKIGLTTLGFERFMTVAAVSALPGRKGGFLDRRAGDVAAGVLTTPGEGALVGRMTDIVRKAARARGVDKDPVLRQRIAHLDMMERVFQYTSARNAASVASGKPGVSGSIVKLVRSELARLGREVGMEVLGAHGLLSESAQAGSTIQHFALSSPYTSIAGGTDEIQRNLVAERILGLPREEAVDRDRPFREVLSGTQAGSGKAGA
jgi:alkylation response protein AidB-like acyl-CoA dehydrogenase